MSKDALDKWLPALISALVLGGFAVLGSSLVGVSHEVTAERIAQNQRQSLLEQLQQLVPGDRYDNRLLDDTLDLPPVGSLGGAPLTVYRARRNGEPVAAIFSPVITQGYSGSIQLIVAINVDASVAGVRVLKHQETPGLGDKIEIERSPWIGEFAGRSLRNPPPQDWKVKRDGGVFDQFTGATITPRAVVLGVQNTLEYFTRHREQVFAGVSEPAGSDTAEQEPVHD